MKRPQRLAAVLLVVATATIGLGVPASAATASTVGVTLTTTESGDLGAGSALRTQVAINNRTTVDTVPATATLTVASTPFTSRAALAAWFAGTTKSSTAGRKVAAVSVPAVTAKLSATVELDAASDALPFTKAGVYPVSVSVGDGTTVIGTARTAVAWNGASAATVPVSIAVPLTVPAGNSDFLTAAELSTYTGPAGILTTELADVKNTRVAVGIDPRVIASIRVLGTSVPASAKEWLDELGALSNETFPLAWGDADLTSPLHAGSPKVITPKSLEYAINPSLFGSSSASTPSPTPTSGSDDSVLPTSASLVAWKYTMPQLEWPADSSVEPTDLPTLATAGITSVILTTKNIDKADARGLGGASGTSSGTTIAVSDDVLSGYFRAATASTTRPGANQPLTELTTTLALIGLESGKHPRSVLLTLDRNWAATSTNFSRTVNELYARSWIVPTTLSDVFAETPTKVTLDKDSEPADRVELVRQMLLAEARVVRFSPVAKDPVALNSSYRLQLMALLSNEWLATPALWQTAGAAYVQQADAVTASVQVSKSSTILGLADQLPLPISISNGLDQDATVTLSVRSKSTNLSIDPADQTQTITIPAGSQKRLQIPIQAVGNGKARVVVTLRSSTGQPVGTPVNLTVNVQAGWETIGTAVFVALIVALFGFGIIRRFRRSRREAGEPAAEVDAADE